jgi:glucan 1,3-beta-glucosidase
MKLANALSLDIGEAFGHGDWFFNATNLEWSLKAVDGVLSFMKTSGHLGSFTFAPFNEVSDTHLAGFGSAAGLTKEGTDWANTYLRAVLKKIAKIDKRIPLMLQDSFQGEQFWSPFYDASTNIVIDTHIYYFAAAGTYSQYVAPAICGQGSAAGGDKKFPVFIGEWSLQTQYNNTLANRKTLFDTQRYAWSQYVSGGSFWNIRNKNTASVDGEGSVGNYWDYMSLIDAGVITPQTDSAYC